MSLKVKICGLRDKANIEAAIDHGADYLGFVFFPASPRNIEPEEAGMLIAPLPPEIQKVGLIVDEQDEAIDRILRHCALDFLQLHGQESPERVASIKRRFGKKIIKAIPVEAVSDLAQIEAYRESVDMFLFDAKPRPEDRRPGGNARSFDWSLLQGVQPDRPWLLAGGLKAENLTQAVKESGAAGVDVSSGVEITPGCKSAAMIGTFLDVAKRLGS